MNDSANFNELNTKGFVVVRDVFTQDELLELEQAWSDSCNNKNTRYKDGIIVGYVGPKVKSKLLEISAKITNQTGITINRIRDRFSFYLPYNKEWGFHQDHEPYYIFQDQTKSINFWIPIRKPDATKTGISFMPTDLFLELEPDLVKSKIIGQGAKVFTELNDGRTEIKDNESGEVYTINRHLSDYEITPEVSVGDVIAIRGDNVHRTQDNSTTRLAASIWAADDQTVLSKKKFYSGAEIKTKRFSLDNESFVDVINAYNSSSSDHITIGDIFKNKNKVNTQ